MADRGRGVGSEAARVSAGLLEFYFEDSAPHEALGRAARRLTQGGALYLGAGVGVERVRGEKAESYNVLTGSGTESHSGPLSAATRAFTLAGEKKDSETPGGMTAVKDPAVAARLRELDDAETSTKRNVRELEDRLRRKKTPGGPIFGTSLTGPDEEGGWEQRRLLELRGQLSRIAAERKRLLAGGKLEEEAAPGAGGASTVGPDARKKLAPLVKHYMGQAHPFGACVRDQVKHGLSQGHAERRCAVIKDIGSGTTHWRKGGRRVKEAWQRLDLIDAALGEGASSALAARAGTLEDPVLDAVAETAWRDRCALYLCGEITEEELTLSEEWSEASRLAALAAKKKAHPDWNWSKGDYARNRYGQVTRVEDPRPDDPVHVLTTGKMREKMDNLAPIDAPKVKKVPDDHPKIKARYQVHHGGEHVGDVVHFSTSHDVRASHGNISIGSRGFSGWEIVEPGKKPSMGSKLPGGKQYGVERLLTEHLKKKEATAAEPHNQIARLQKQLEALPQGNENRTAAQQAEAARLRQAIKDLHKAGS